MYRPTGSALPRLLYLLLPADVHSTSSRNQHWALNVAYSFNQPKLDIHSRSWFASPPFRTSASMAFCWEVLHPPAWMLLITLHQISGYTFWQKGCEWKAFIIYYVECTFMCLQWKEYKRSGIKGWEQGYPFSIPLNDQLRDLGMPFLPRVAHWPLWVIRFQQFWPNVKQLQQSIYITELSLYCWSKICQICITL